MSIGDANNELKEEKGRQSYSEIIFRGMFRDLAAASRNKSRVSQNQMYSFDIFKNTFRFLKEAIFGLFSSFHHSVVKSGIF